LPGGGGDDCAEPTAYQSASPQPTCEDLESAFIETYLSKLGSPLASLARTMVTMSDAAGIDDRFIVALAGVESTYGKNTRAASWGQYNAWSNSTHCAALIPGSHCQAINPYTSLLQALNSVVSLITGQSYFGAGLKTTDEIYGTYCPGCSAGYLGQRSPVLGTTRSVFATSLNNLYLGYLGGGKPGTLIGGSNAPVDFSRCAPQ
jgi:hypothetical protein